MILKYRGYPLKTRLNRTLNPFWGLGPNPAVWIAYWVMRARRVVRYSIRTEYEFSIDLACLIVRLRQIRNELGDGPYDEHWLLDRIITCDLHRMEGWLDSNQWNMIWRGEDNGLEGAPPEGTRREATQRSVGGNSDGDTASG